MNRGGANWHAALLKRFADRDDIGKERLYELYFKDLPKKEVFECLALIENEYQIRAGLLRPSDNLTKLFEPVATSNPLKWLIYQVREGDSKSEINYELFKRQQRYGTNEEWGRVGINTIDDLIHAWCGQRPK
jgi:hypothetical protein